jgi:hypothetical protein
MKTKTGIIAALLAASLVGSSAFATDTTAPTSAAYAEQATEFRASAERHEKMAQIHKAGGAGSQKSSHENIVRHCEKIAKDLRAAADESDALATELKAAGQ